MGSLRVLHDTAHPNSILRKKYPNGIDGPAALPNWDTHRTDYDARVNTGFPDDYITPANHDAEWDNPSLTDLDAA